MIKPTIIGSAVPVWVGRKLRFRIAADFDLGFKDCPPGLLKSCNVTTKTSEDYAVKN